MPEYQYRCFNCGTTTDELRSIAARNDAKTCNSCGCPETFLVIGSTQDPRHKGDPRVMSDAALTREDR